MTEQNKEEDEIDTIEIILGDLNYIKVVPIPDLEVSVLNAYCEQCNHKCADKVDEPCHEAQGNSAKVLSLVSQYLHQLAQGMEVISDDVMQAVKPTTGEWHQYENEHGAKTADPKASFMACWIEKMLQAQLTADKEAMERG